MSTRTESLTTFIGEHGQLVRLAVALGTLASELPGDFSFFRLKPRKIILCHTLDGLRGLAFGIEHLSWFVREFPEVSILFEQKSSDGDWLRIDELRHGRGGTVRDDGFDNFEDPAEDEDQDALDQLVHQHSVDCARQVDLTGEYASKVRVLDKYAPLDPTYGFSPYKFARARSAHWTEVIEFFGPSLPLMNALGVRSTPREQIDLAKAQKIKQTYKIESPPPYQHILHHMRIDGSKCPFYQKDLASIGEDIRSDEPGSGMYLLNWLCWDERNG